MTHDPRLDIDADGQYSLISREGLQEWLDGDSTGWAVYASIGGVRMSGKLTLEVKVGEERYRVCLYSKGKGHEPDRTIIHAGPSMDRAIARWNERRHGV